MSRRLAGAAALAVGLGSLTLVGVPVASYAAPAGDSCPSADVEEAGEDPPKTPGEPLEAMQIPQAQQIARRMGGGRDPGDGVVVAVVDSGVYSAGIAPVAKYTPPADVATISEATYYQGTAVAGLIAGGEVPGVGTIGIAPGASIYDVRVYDAPRGGGGDDLVELRTDNVVAGLTYLRDHLSTPAGRVRIANVSLDVPHSPALQAVVKDLTKAGVIVVASTGDRVGSDALEPGEDVALSRFPAGYSTAGPDWAANPLVVAVGTTNSVDEGFAVPRGLLSSAIDVVVPSYGATSLAYSKTGVHPCVFYDSSTATAAAEVSGILAMLMTSFDATPRELVARLKATATRGATTSDVPDRYQGHGIVQPLEALDRDLPANPEGAVLDVVPVEPEAVPATLPVAEPDVLRDTRRNAVWWGLFGGGALVVALLLRPVFSRRRG